VPGATRHFFISVVHSPLGVVGYVAASKLSSRGGEAGATWQRRSSTQQGGEARVDGTQGGTGAHLGSKAMSGAVGHMAAPEPTSAGRCGPKLQLMWQRVEARPTPCLDLELICRGTRYLGC
jgi:hypothetical protein